MSHIVDLHLPWQQAIKKSAAIKEHASKTNQTLSRVSVVLVAKGHYLEALATLVSLLPKFLVREIILVDCIQSAEFQDKIHSITHEYASIIVIAGKPGMSLAHAYNLGRRQCSSRYALFLQTPGVVSDNFLSKMLALGMGKQEPWVVGVESQTTIDPLLNLIDSPETHSPSHGAYSGHLVTAVESSGFLLPCELLIAVGLFDEQCSDSNVLLDYSLRLHTIGADIYSDAGLSLPKSVLPMNYGAKRVGISQQWRQWHYYYRKHFGLKYKKTHVGLLAFKLVVKNISHFILCFAQDFFRKFSKSNKASSAKSNS